MVMTSLLTTIEPGLTVLNGLRTNGLSLVPPPSANFGFEVVFSGSASSMNAITCPLVGVVESTVVVTAEAQRETP